MTRLGDVLADVKPGFATGDNLDDGVFQFRMHNFTRESALDLTKRRRVNATARQLEMQSVAPGDVLFNATNSPELVGKSALIGELDEPAVFSNHFMRLRTDLTQLDPGYLAHFLRFQFGRGVFRAMAKAWVNQATIGRDRLEGLNIPLPPLREQRRVAAILDHADALRAKRGQVLSHLDVLTQSIFHEMFGDVAADRTVGEIAEIQGGLQVSSKRAYLPVEVPYLRVANAYRGRLDLTQVKTLRATEPEIGRTRLRPGDLLFVEGHGNPGEVGRVAVWNGEIEICVHQNHLIRARLEESRALPVFAAAWLNTDQGAAHFRRAGRTTSGLNTISASTVRGAPLPLPPIDRQREFAAKVDLIKRQHSHLRRAMVADDRLFASLQSRAFQGEL